MRTGQPLSRTGSYGDYLKAQQEAKKAQAAIGARTGNIYEDAAREAQGSQPDMGTGQRLATQEDAWRKRASAWASDMFKSRQAYAEAQKAKESAHQERLRSEAEQKRALGYAADDGEAYRKWSDEVNQSARRSGTGSIGAGAYYGGKPPRG